MSSDSLSCRKMETKPEECVVFQQDLLSHDSMGEMRRQGKFCDVTLKVDSQSFSAHRIVLAANIPYFRAMFSLDMLEQKQRSITIEAIEAKVLEAIINFAYSGRITIDINNVQSLMMGACFLQLPKVIEACSDFLKERLHPSNVLRIRSLANTLGCDPLVDASEKYIQENFHDVSASEEYLMLSQSEVLDFVKRDELCVVSEQEVFEAVMRWIRKDPEGRQQDLPQLLSNVRMPLLTPCYLADRVAAEELIRSSLECRDLLDEARDYHLMPGRRPQLQSCRTRPRNCKIGHIFAVGRLTPLSYHTVEVYDPIENQWQQVRDMKILRCSVGVAVLRNRLYAFGGYDESEVFSTVEVFDLQKRIWSRIASMHYKRRSCAAAALNDRLYVCGGYDGSTTLNSVECYLPDKDEWINVASMTKHRRQAGVVACEGYIYALGGCVEDAYGSRLVERYDPRTGQWQDAKSMLTPRSKLGAATLNGKIYVCGGRNRSTALQSVEVFDPATNKWKYVASMNVERDGVALVANMGKLWAIGGNDGESPLSSVEVYDPNSDSWSCAASMSAPMWAVAAAVLPM